MLNIDTICFPALLLIINSRYMYTQFVIWEECVKLVVLVCELLVCTHINRSERLVTLLCIWRVTENVGAEFLMSFIKDKRKLNPAPRLTQVDKTQPERHNKTGFSGLS